MRNGSSPGSAALFCLIVLMRLLDACPAADSSPERGHPARLEAAARRGTAWLTRSTPLLLHPAPVGAGASPGKAS